MNAETSDAHLLTFDVFGTVVDWRGSIARAAAAVARTHSVELDANDFEDLAGQLGV